MKNQVNGKYWQRETRRKIRKITKVLTRKAHASSKLITYISSACFVGVIIQLGNSNRIAERI